jgi:hypothetical protein
MSERRDCRRPIGLDVRLEVSRRDTADGDGLPILPQLAEIGRAARPSPSATKPEPPDPAVRSLLLAACDALTTGRDRLWDAVGKTPLVSRRERTGLAKSVHRLVLRVESDLRRHEDQTSASKSA